MADDTEQKRKRLRYLQLKAKAAQAASPRLGGSFDLMQAPRLGGSFDLMEPPAGPAAVADGLAPATTGGGVTLGPLAHLALKAGDVAGFDMSSRGAAAGMALGDILADKTGKSSFGDAYRRNLGFIDQSMAASDEAHPARKWLGRGLGVAAGLGGGALVGRAIAAARGAPAAVSAAGMTLGQLLGEGAKVGLVTGAAGGMGAGRSDTIGGKALDGTLGGLLGMGLGVALPAAAATAGWTARNVGAPIMKLLRGGYVKPTPEAQRLMSQGAELTLGRMDPASTLGRFEEIATSKATGGSLKALRNRADQTARDVILKAAGAPEAAGPSRGAAVAQQLDELRAGYSQVYDEALEGAKLQPEQYLGAGKWRGLLSDPNAKGAAKTQGAFELAAKAKDIDASPSVRARALSWLTDKAQTLAPAKSGPNAGTVDARSVHSLRTQLRDKIRGLGEEGDDRQLREIYGRAEEFVTELLEGQLPPEKAAMLRAADASYRNLLSVDDAARRAFVQGQEFTPAQLLMSIRNRGSTPELEALTRDAHGVLSATYPLTGVQGIAGEVAPISRVLGPAFAHASNVSPWLKHHALTQKFAPGLPARAASTVGRAVESAGRSPGAAPLTIRTLLDLLSEPQQVAP